MFANAIIQFVPQEGHLTTPESVVWGVSLSLAVLIAGLLVISVFCDIATRRPWLMRVGLFVSLGCGVLAVFVATRGSVRVAHERIETFTDITLITLAYHNFHDTHGRSPHDASELLAFDDAVVLADPSSSEMRKGGKKEWQSLLSSHSIGERNRTRERLRAVLTSGKYIVIWDAPIQRTLDTEFGNVLAYHRDAPEKGGVACDQNGLTRWFSREEFERTPKAQPAVGKGK